MLIPLKLLRDKPLQQQLYDQLRDLIATTRLAPGTRMPSTRMMADQFAVSRITVLLSYERLIAEGYLVTLPSRGTFVARTRCPDRMNAVHECDTRANPEPLPPETRIGRPDPSLFPANRWRALMRGALDRMGANLGHDHPDGHPALRTEISRWFSASRGLAVDPDQIILASGRQQALNIASLMLLRPGARAVVEDPCDTLTAEIMASADVSLVRVPVDTDGLQTDRLPPGPAALVHVTPEHQRPLGGVLPQARRMALLEWAAQAGAMVLEDDCDCELRYESLDTTPLMALDHAGLVVHVGSFAAALGPGLTLGYLVVPPRLISAALASRRLVDDHTSWLEESALADFLESGAYARHLHRIRKAYLSRRNALVAALRDNFGDTGLVTGGGAGLHLAWHLPAGIGLAHEVVTAARRCGLDAAPLPDRHVPHATQIVLLGFGMPTERRLESAVGRLATDLLGGDMDAVSPIELSAD